MQLKKDAPVRKFFEIYPGDYVKFAGQWLEVLNNSANGFEDCPPKTWTIKTKTHGTLTMFQIERYAKKEDFE